MNDRCKQYWITFLNETSRDINTMCYECFFFGSNKKSADELLQLVLSGKKKATTSSLLAFDDVPQVNDLSIVTDFEGNPQCIIQTLSVRQMLFSKMTFTLAALEGEDENLLSWQKNHIAYFKWEASQKGYEFNLDMPIVFEEFTVVYR